MKPKSLKLPFSWGETFVGIEDRVFHTFENFGETTDFIFPGWESPEVFENNHPVKIEFCSGNGAWIAHKAEEEPHANWVSVEMRFVRTRKIWSKLKNRRLNNLFCVSGEAMNVASRYFPRNSVDEIYINFPDPWPKKRHAKYRLIKPDFIDVIASLLKPEGILTFVTDHPGYSEETIEIARAHPHFTSVYEEPHFVTDYPNYGSSFFEELWKGKGLEIRYHKFKRGV